MTRDIDLTQTLDGLWWARTTTDRHAHGPWTGPYLCEQDAIDSRGLILARVWFWIGGLDS